MKGTSLIAASAVFFFLWVAMPVTLATRGAIGSQVVIFLLSLVSLVGSTQFLRTVRHESPRWFWGIPFVAVCAALVLWTGIADWVVTVPDIANRAFLFLLPPATALFFHSFPDDCRSGVRIAVSALVSVPSLILAFYALVTLTAPHPLMPGFTGTIAVVYTLLLMPLVGVLLVTAEVACR